MNIKKKRKKTKARGHKCPGKSLAKSMLGASMHFINRSIDGVGHNKSGAAFGSEEQKAFAQWKWHWSSFVELDIVNNMGEERTIKKQYNPPAPVDLFSLEDYIFSCQVIAVMEQEGFSVVTKRWKAEIVGLPI
jgi:hypothetical protein